MLLRIFSLLSLFAFPNLLLSEPIHFRAKLMCDEISAKSFSVNGEISNVAMDGEGLIAQVEVEEKDGKRSNYLTTKFPSLGSKTRYEGVINLLNTDAKGNQILKAQFVAKNGGTFGTKTVTITFQQSTGLYFMISTEPFALGTDYPAIRTHFHQCKPIK